MTSQHDNTAASAPLTRRQFLISTVGAGSMLLLAACGSGAQPSSPAPAGGNKQIILTAQSEPLQYNPAFGSDSTLIYYSQFVFDGLTRPDDNLNPIPSLAESWEVTPDGLNYTFKLRQGVKFHDGQPLTAADVKFTWELISHPANKAGLQLYGFFSRIKGAEAFHSGAAKDISGVTTPDDSTVKVEMASVYAPLLAISAFQPIIPKHVYGAVAVEELPKHATARAPIGTGPFKFVDWKANDVLSYAANAGYWGGRPKIDHLLVKIVPDATTLPSLLRSNAIDVMGLYRGLAPTDFDAFSKDKSFHVMEMVGYDNLYIEFDVTNPLFEDVNVRRALIHAVDRPGIVKGLMLGHGQVVDSPIHPNSWAYTAPKTAYEYNPDKAKSLLSAAGWKPGADGILAKDGKKFSFELPTFVADYPELVQAQWRQVGVDAQIKRMDFAAFWAPLYLARKLSAAALHVIIGIYTDPDYPLAGYFSSKLDRNHYNNPKIDDLIAQGTATTDQGQRKQRYADFIETLSQDAPHMWVGLPTEIWATTSKITLPNKKLGFLLVTNVKDWDRAA